MTFTNKAAREMRERVTAMLDRPAEGLWLGTFHALAARMLRRHATLIGLTASFNILDTDDQLRLLKQVMEAEKVDAKRWLPQALMAIIQRWKDRGLTPERVTAAEDSDFANGRARAMGDLDGFVKILADAKTDKVLGAHILGPDAGTLIAEMVMAIEFGASAEDVARISHAHPTLNEVVKEAALAVGARALHI